VSAGFTSYQIQGGVESHISPRVGTALEVQYTRVPNHLAGGLGDAFNEHDLGGVQVRIKLLVGKGK